MDLVKQLEKLGKIKVTYLPVDSNGLVDLDALSASLEKDTVLVTMAAVNYMVVLFNRLRILVRLSGT